MLAVHIKYLQGFDKAAIMSNMHANPPKTTTVQPAQELM
jgi:hypothetical protein